MLKSATYMAIVMAVSALFAPNLLRAQESLPISIGAFVDSRVGMMDYHWNTGAAPDQHLSDAYVRYAGVEFTAAPNEHVEAKLIVLFEEFFADPAGDGFNLDEGWVKLMNQGAYLKLGKGYPAFALEDTWGVEDPMTWYVADHRKTIIEAGYEHEFFTVSAAFFNGDFDLTYSDGAPKDERIDDYVIHLHFTPLARVEGQHLEVGACYLSDFTETALDFGNVYFISPVYKSPVPAWEGHLDYRGSVGGPVELGLKAAYLQTEQFSRSNYVDLDGNKTGITMTNVEAALFVGPGWLGATYSSIDGLDWLHAHDLDPSLTPTRFERWGGYAGISLNDNTSLAVQVMNGTDDAGDRLLESYFQLLFEY